MLVMNPVRIDPEVMSGTPCFAGTRVPVRTLFDVLETGHTIDDLLTGYARAGAGRAGTRQGQSPHDRGAGGMKVLIDESLDVRLHQHLTGHDAYTVAFHGMEGA